MSRGQIALGVVAGVAIVIGLSARMSAPAPSPEDSWELVVLGIAQDAGIPHLSCQQTLCVSIRNGTREPERVASIGLINRATRRAYMFDATPDMSSQIHSLTGGLPPDGVFLTHGHMGHYTGLMYLGRESIDADSVPVYGTGRMTSYLRTNGPWSQLVTRENIKLRTLVPDETLDLGDGIRVTPFLVPHRDEYTDAVGYRIEGPRQTAIYIPDIDQWDRWDTNIRDLANEVDLALIDGSFAEINEIPGRTIEDIPHPLMSVTRELLRGVSAEVWFIHLNHTNQQIDASDVVKDGMTFPM